MSRKRKQLKREITPDHKFSSMVITKFINKIMKGGKKNIAQGIVYKALDKLSQEVSESPIKAFEQVLKNTTPMVEVKSRRVGGSTYQVPVEVKSDRGMALAMRWLIGNSRNKKGIPMADALAKEMIDSFNGVGSSVKKCEDTHKMAAANKAFAHYKW